MLPLILWIIVFIVSLIVLIKAADFFTDSAEEIGIYFGMPAFVVGVLIVALGTSLPEIVSSIIAVLQNSSEIVVGNVVGSNIANIFLVLGVAGIVGKHLKVTKELIKVDLPLLIGTAFLLAATIWDGYFTILEGIICLIVFLIYILYSINSQKEDKEIQMEMKGSLKKKKLKPKTWILLFLGAFFIYLGAKYTIDSIINLSEILNIGKEVIAITAVALGTSLPELMVTISAARKGKAEIAIGNVLGSNIFNAMAVMGIPALLSDLIVPKSVLMFGLPMMIIGTLIFLFIVEDREVTKWEGWLLVMFYVFFIGKMFNLL